MGTSHMVFCRGRDHLTQQIPIPSLPGYLQCNMMHGEPRGMYMAGQQPGTAMGPIVSPPPYPVVVARLVAGCRAPHPAPPCVAAPSWLSRGFSLVTSMLRPTDLYVVFRRSRRCLSPPPTIQWLSCCFQKSVCIKIAWDVQGRTEFGIAMGTCRQPPSSPRGGRSLGGRVSRVAPRSTLCCRPLVAEQGFSLDTSVPRPTAQCRASRRGRRCLTRPITVPLLSCHFR